MSEVMASPPPESPDDIAAAFDAMRRQLALLTSATQGFAAQQDKIAARDYAPDLARIIDLQDKMVDAINTLARRPGVALTPEIAAAQIDKAAATVRQADHEALAKTTRELDAMVGRVREERQQRDALIWAWLGGIITLMVVMIVAQLVWQRMS